MNVHESEKMYAAFASYGVGMATDPDSADIIVMNTCCVREGAETRVIGNLGLVKKLKERKKDLPQFRAHKAALSRLQSPCGQDRRRCRRPVGSAARTARRGERDRRHVDTRRGFRSVQDGGNAHADAA